MEQVTHSRTSAASPPLSFGMSTRRHGLRQMLKWHDESMSLLMLTASSSFASSAAAKQPILEPQGHGRI